ncbi:protein of unknown function [Polaribacter sp. Hel1_33_78]|jgi:hypothetical protein|uniref:DUF4932 domain-containing protein n=1 Tax=Polaribacter sp. Hel1_33_78 TaxID=1336804 RepID=UPI00087BEDA7|nr:DUF4932 domain-containing protein [Polaribacter sp. Hel1_33_78]SDU12332.1 protein of unknown function [Polaribacter sp. Hel1_33_78]
MIRKTLKFFGKLLLVTIILLAVLVITYLIKPEFIENKAIDIFYPTVNIENKYRDKIIVENPEVYELMQIACSLTETFQNDQNLTNHKTGYYTNFINHFKSYKNHELVLKLNEYLKPNPYGSSQFAIRLLSLNYEINDSNKLKSNSFINVNPILIKLFKSKAFLISENIKLIEDFANKSGFKNYYAKHKNYYAKLISNYSKLCDFQNMKVWLENKFSSKYQSYRIIFSPLTGGFHNTMKFKNNDKNLEQTFMFVNAPYENIDNLPEKEFEIKSSKMARVVFTEIDHNYVNPLTDKYNDELKNAMIDYKFWNNQKGGMYQSSYNTFNEYMTWGVFNLYALDTYSKENIDTIIKIQTDFINDKRKFNQFRDFNKELIKQYNAKSKPKIEEIYKPILEWIEQKSVPNNVYN